MKRASRKTGSDLKTNMADRRRFCPREKVLDLLVGFCRGEKISSSSPNPGRVGRFGVASQWCEKDNERFQQDLQAWSGVKGQGSRVRGGAGGGGRGKQEEQE